MSRPDPISRHVLCGHDPERRCPSREVPQEAVMASVEPDVDFAEGLAPRLKVNTTVPPLCLCHGSSSRDPARTSSPIFKCRACVGKINRILGPDPCAGGHGFVSGPEAVQARSRSGPQKRPPIHHCTCRCRSRLGARPFANRLSGPHCPEAPLRRRSSTSRQPPSTTPGVRDSLAAGSPEMLDGRTGWQEKHPGGREAVAADGACDQPPSGDPDEILVQRHAKRRG